MENIRNSQLIQLQLSRCVDRIGQLSMEAVVGIDRLADRSDVPVDLVFFNEFASSLELMQSQLDYYFPAGAARFDLDEWADALAVLNSGADYIEDQSIELGARMGESQLSGCLESFSLAYAEAIPCVIAARLAHEEPELQRESETARVTAERVSPPVGIGSSRAAQLLTTTQEYLSDWPERNHQQENRNEPRGTHPPARRDRAICHQSDQLLRPA